MVAEKRKGAISMTVKINSLELENVKRIKAVKLVPSRSPPERAGHRPKNRCSGVLCRLAAPLSGHERRLGMDRRRELHI